MLQHFSLILDKKVCRKCHKECEITKVGEKFNFYCTSKHCGSKYTVSPKYFFSNIRVYYTDALLIMYFFLHNETVSRVVTYLDVSEPTVIDWINLIGLMYIYMASL